MSGHRLRRSLLLDATVKVSNSGCLIHLRIIIAVLGLSIQLFSLQCLFSVPPFRTSPLQQWLPSPCSWPESEASYPAGICISRRTKRSSSRWTRIWLGPSPESFANRRAPVHRYCIQDWAKRIHMLPWAARGICDFCTSFLPVLSWHCLGSFADFSEVLCSGSTCRRQSGKGWLEWPKPRS